MGLDLNLVHLRCLGHSSGCLVAYGTSDRRLRAGWGGEAGRGISVSQSSVHSHQVPGSGDVSACEKPTFCFCSGDMGRAGPELLGRKAMPAT